MTRPSACELHNFRPRANNTARTDDISSTRSKLTKLVNCRINDWGVYWPASVVRHVSLSGHQQIPGHIATPTTKITAAQNYQTAESTFSAPPELHLNPFSCDYKPNKSRHLNLPSYFNYPYLVWVTSLIFKGSWDRHIYWSRNTVRVNWCFFKVVCSDKTVNIE